MIIKELIKTIEESTKKSVFTKRMSLDSFNSNTYILEISNINQTTQKIYGNIIFAGEILELINDFKNISQFYLIDNVNVVLDYFNDDIIYSQKFAYVFNKKYITQSTSNLENIIMESN